MNRFPWYLGAILVLAALALVSCRGGRTGLGGASAPRLETLAAPPAPIQIDDAFVTPDYNPFAETAPPHEQRFPSGTKKIECVIVFKDIPPDGTRVTCDVVGPSGKVEGSGGWMQMGNPIKHLLKTWTDVEPKAGLADGAYQATIGINDMQVYRLNWSVGSK